MALCASWLRSRRRRGVAKKSEPAHLLRHGRHEAHCTPVSARVRVSGSWQLGFQRYWTMDIGTDASTHLRTIGAAASRFCGLVGWCHRGRPSCQLGHFFGTCWMVCTFDRCDSNLLRAAHGLDGCVRAASESQSTFVRRHVRRVGRACGSLVIALTDITYGADAPLHASNVWRCCGSLGGGSLVMPY